MIPNAPKDFSDWGAASSHRYTCQLKVYPKWHSSAKQKMSPLVTFLSRHFWVYPKWHENQHGQISALRT
ncbi:hypothetical protein ALP74_200257 [Pseudomonas coronafaciens pv. garcae]|uniref:Uncharacterized protein n=1 Tax=Pseudomonas coronafaciens pv. garcae TaxID=251653 RepID=A0AB37QJB3_9PSED|nr:hypothetical protein ALP74_200257 [Pseudomonas coronafaciens pv. garcae]RMS34054.1 hypothetical protein ALP71_200001 [Pseudomonas coronafaciens pv. garcae]